MKDGKEIERRFVVRGIDPDFRRAPSTRFVQGYFDTSPLESLRVRVVDNDTAVITRKYGSGLSRDEKELTLPLDVAKMLLVACGGKVLRKTRYVKDGWEVDEFDHPLSGLILAEFEMSSEEEEVTLPPWISDAVEVTLSLTNEHLAHLANDLGSETPNKPVRDLLPKRIPRVVLTGGPCSGKSTVIQHVREEFGDVIHCVPEVATIVISQVGIVPPNDDPVALRKFQRTIAQVQRGFEDVSNEQALRDGKKLVLLDRGIMDSAAYMDGGINELHCVLGTSSAEEYSRYEHVIYLASPPRAVYEANMANNPARSEPYEKARELGLRIWKAWTGHGIGMEFGHPRIHSVPNERQLNGLPKEQDDSLSWEEKWQSVKATIQSILDES